VVVGIDVEVEQLGPGYPGDGVHHGAAPTFADVHHAFEHASGSDDAELVPKGTVTPVNLGAPELLIVLLVVLVLFGGAKLPKLARSMGQAQTEFKKGLKEGIRHDDEGEATKAD
jgi:sec-independent protein translocase protein TatA